MTEVGELTVKIKADAAQLDREMRKANAVVQQSTGAMGTALGGLKNQFAALVPVLGVSALVGFAKSAFDAADQLDDFRKRTGFAVESLSALKTPLLIADSNLEEFSASIARMNNLVGEAAAGLNETAIKAFDDLGLSINSLNALSPEQQFYEIARALGEIESQSEFTNRGMAIFGRSFINIAPLIKDANGEVEGFVESAKQMGAVITQEQVDRIGDLNDRWTVFIEDSKKGLLELIPLIEWIANAPKYIRGTIDMVQKGGEGVGNYIRTGNVQGINPVSEERPVSVDFAVFQGQEQYGPTYQRNGAKGSNSSLLNTKGREAAAKQISDARAALDDYNRSLEQEQALLGLSERDRAAQIARFRVEEIARKGNITLTKEQTEATAALAASNYDLEKAQEEVNKATQEAARFQQELHDKLSASLTDIVFRANSAKDAMLGFAESIARAAFEKKVAGPFADMLIGTGGKSGILDGAIGGIGDFFGGFFAEGGRPPVGVPSIVGERGPEIFMPDTAGTVIPNNKIGGTTVIVQQTIQVNPGVPELINQRIREATPGIAAMAVQSVATGLQSGGSLSRITGLRN